MTDLEKRSLAPVQMLWFGRPLNSFERLSMLSFIGNGHAVHLYTYGEVEGVPEGVKLKNASEVIDESEFQSMRSSGVKTGPISDAFRYRLLQKRGGWWADCDVVCLRPFDFASEIVFGWQDKRVMNGAVIRLPAGHEAAARLVTLARHPNRWMRGDPPRRIARKARDTVLGRSGLGHVTWGAAGPAAVTTVATGMRLLHHAMATEVFFPVPWEGSARLYERGRLSLSSATYAVHLWNEMRGSREPDRGSPIHGWLEAYGV